MTLLSRILRALFARNRLPETGARERGALQLLGLLQREGRLIDYLMEPLDSYSDAEVGSAARSVHGGLRKALLAHVELVRVRPEPEGAQLTAEAPSAELRFTGNVVGDGPAAGRLMHQGWRATRVELPELAGGVQVIAPAEIEIA